MKKFFTTLLAIAFLAGGMATPAGAALNAVSPAVDPVDGFPIWYEDTNLLRLEQCQDPTAFCLNPQLTLPNPALPEAFPGNFPVETFYWNATAKINDPNVDATLIMALEGSFANGVVAVAGDQVVFARIRFTINPRTAATANAPFTVTHPFGTINVTTRGIGQRLLVTQDVGIAAGIFTGALANAPAGGIVNADGRSIGPFLTAAPPSPARVPGTGASVGGTFLSDGVTLIRLQGGPLGINDFTISGGGVVITEPTFTLIGKVSGCVVGIVAPVAVTDAGAAASGAAQVINVTANDTPGTTPGPPVATMPINKASIAITVPPANGTAVPKPDGTVIFTPNPTFVGNDSFTYTVSDNCGTVSNAVAVPVVVENLTVDRAEFRPKTGKWTVTGQSSAAAGSTMTVHKGADPATGPVIGSTTVKADGTYKFVGKSKTTPASPTQAQSISAQSAASVTRPKVLKVE